MDLFDHLPCPALILHEDFTIHRANDAACALLDNQALKKGDIALPEHCDRKTIKELKNILPSLKNGVRLKKVLKMHRNDRMPITVGASLSILPYKKVLILLTEHDKDQSCTPGCHKLRILEEQYQHNPAGILLVNHKMEMISYNRQFLKMWNIPDHVQQSRDEKQEPAGRNGPSQKAGNFSLKGP